MAKSRCGLDCGQCGFRETCGGCAETDGKPFGGTCMIDQCCKTANCLNRGNCFHAFCGLKNRLIREFNELGIPDMDEVTDLNALWGAYINQEYPTPGGKTVKFWDDDRVILGNQLHKRGTDRCYGLAADENYLLVCEYGENGADPEIVVFKRRGK